jgi:predicted DNA-binding transcriptional regulator YafY
MVSKEEKSFRLLRMYELLSRGGALNKRKLVEHFGVSDKTVQRDIDDLRAYLSPTWRTTATTSPPFFAWTESRDSPGRGKISLR